MSWGQSRRAKAGFAAPEPVAGGSGPFEGPEFRLIRARVRVLITLGLGWALATGCSDRARPASRGWTGVPDATPPPACLVAHRTRASCAVAGRA